ncbi:MAG: site-specific DNA-methyltransferase [Verrucomicrobiales bacterium]
MSQEKKVLPEQGMEFHHRDCVEGMRLLPEDCVDLVVTSPPYNLGIDYGAYDDGGDREAYLEWSVAWAAGVRRVLAPGGSFFLNLGAAPKNPLLPHQLALRFSEIFVLQNTFHWIKSITVESAEGVPTSVGHFKPINSKRFVNDCHEYLFHFTLDGKVELDRLGVGVPYQDKSNITRWGHSEGRDRRCRGNNWFVPYKTINSRGKERPHPATFPAKLAEYCIRIHGGPPETMTMLDPFLGIGHAAVAAENLGVRRFIGYEIDEGYLAVACEKFAIEPIML